jgi:hypothetical protein
VAQAVAAEAAAMAAKVAVVVTLVEEDVVVGSVIVLIVSVQTMEEQAVMEAAEAKVVEERDITGMETMPLLIFKLQVVGMVQAVVAVKEEAIEEAAKVALAVAEVKAAHLNQMVKAEAKVVQELKALEINRVVDTIPLVEMGKEAKVAEVLEVIMVKFSWVVAAVYLISNLNHILIQS